MTLHPSVFLIGLLGILLASCSPETLSASPGDEASESGVTAPPPAADPVAEAEAVLAERFGGLGWIDSIVSVQVHGSLLRVTLDREIETLGDAEVFSRMCLALTSLISSDEQPTDVTGVQFFRKGGIPVVASGANGAPCGRFYL